MRWISVCLSAVAWTALVLAAVELQAVFADPSPHEATRPLAPSKTLAVVREAQDAIEPTVWPTLFGEPQPPIIVAPTPQSPQPPVVAAAEPQPPAPPKPPLSSLGYELKGVVRAGDAVWSLVAHPTGARIMRVGDTLADGMHIARIDTAGVWVEIGPDTLEVLGFPE